MNGKHDKYKKFMDPITIRHNRSLQVGFVYILLFDRYSWADINVNN